MSKIRIVVPLTPPSVNHYVRHFRNGGHVVTREARAFKDWLGVVARDVGVIDPKAKAIEVDITVFLGMRGKGDVDNFPKVVLDGLVAAGVIRTDARVSDLHVHKRRDQINPRDRDFPAGGIEKHGLPMPRNGAESFQITDENIPF